MPSDDAEVGGASAWLAAEEADGRMDDLAAEIRREDARRSNFTTAALTEPLTAAGLAPLTHQGWRILHDRQWPDSTRANVDHLAIGPTGVTVIDTKGWSGTIEVRAERLWCAEDDRHEHVEDLPRLVAAVEDLLEEVATSEPGRGDRLKPPSPTTKVAGHSEDPGCEMLGHPTSPRPRTGWRCSSGPPRPTRTRAVPWWRSRPASTRTPTRSGWRGRGGHCWPSTATPRAGCRGR